MKIDTVELTTEFYTLSQNSWNLAILDVPSDQSLLKMTIDTASFVAYKKDNNALLLNIILGQEPIAEYDLETTQLIGLSQKKVLRILKDLFSDGMEFLIFLDD